jgi:predicted HTH transcriptional regulator
LREAVINAIVHNDYSFEVPPKFEIFPDRLEITSAGRLPESLTREEFFNGISIPRNKELMRIYRDVELVESLGSGIPRILRAYGEDCFKFTDNFIRITLPISAHDHASNHASDHASVHASVQVKKLISILTREMGRAELQELLSIKNRDYFRTDYLNPAINQGYVEPTIPDKPNSQNQKYRLTAKGVALKNSLTNNK